MRILIVEDDARLADVLRRSLLELGHIAEIAANGDLGYDTALNGTHDVMILDVMLPGRDGLAVARALRKADWAQPILMLTAQDATHQIVAGLEAGADDYLAKPFQLAELEARLKSLCRRILSPRTVLRACGVELDTATLTARRGARMFDLSVREFAFLEFFVRNAGRVLTRAMFEDALWDDRRDSGASNVIDVYVARLRAKVSVGEETALIHTVRSLGYRFGEKHAVRVE